MKLATPRWWYVRDRIPAPMTRMLLTPLSWIWAGVTARRIARTEPFDPGVPVICVGGLTVGGTGKTPVAQALLQRLAAQGAVGLTRGYGGRLAGPVKVQAAHTAAEVGDEPLLLASHAPIWVARDRVEGAKAAMADGAALLILDDGHQNPSLRKTLSLVVVDGETRGREWPFGGGGVFPAGPMREPLKVGLARADAVVVMLPADMEGPDEALLGLFGGKTVLIARLEPAGPPPPGPQLAFAGIAKPWRFEQALTAAGCDLADFATFPDHAAYDEGRLRALAERAEFVGAGLLTTQKDWVRLPPAWRERVACWPVRARFEDEAALEKLLSSVVLGRA
ncbi:MAG: tetraacyldisaccharide 4'-kinase [Caulobacterales bacterium 32-69-10]|nr:MAG: tetraacyldisaccharide 4'-kinase [Caulobacterales bacterium 32-69-10]